MRLKVITGALLGLLAGGPAAAETADFFGAWTNGNADRSGIARVVVSPLPGGRVSVHLYGTCQAAACDWGVAPARAYSDDPGSREVRSIAAEFDAGDARRRVTLHLGVGGLRFDIQTDFASAARPNFATSGNLTRTADWRTEPAVAAATPPPGGSAAAAAATPAAPPPPPPSSGGWLGNLGSGSSLIGVGAAVPPGYIASTWEECAPFNPTQVRVANVDGRWQVGDFAHRLLNLGSSQAAARRAAGILSFYGFDEQCAVTRSSLQMMYWKRASLVPNNDMPLQDCEAVDPAAVKAAESDGTWTVQDGARQLFDFGDDKEAAARAVSVIRTYRLSRQCFFARGNPKAQYWLSQ